MNMSARQLNCDSSGSRRVNLAEGTRFYVFGKILSPGRIVFAIDGRASVAGSLLADRRLAIGVSTGRATSVR